MTTIKKTRSVHIFAQCVSNGAKWKSHLVVIIYEHVLNVILAVSPGKWGCPPTRSQCPPTNHFFHTPKSDFLYFVGRLGGKSEEWRKKVTHSLNGSVIFWSKLWHFYSMFFKICLFQPQCPCKVHFHNK